MSFQANAFQSNAFQTNGPDVLGLASMVDVGSAIAFTTQFSLWSPYLVETVEVRTDRDWSVRPTGSVIALGSAVREMRSPSPIERFFAQAWSANATSRVALRSQAFESRVDRFVEVFLPQGWTPRAGSTIPLRTAGGTAPPVPQFIETFYPRGWWAASATTLAPATVGGILPPTPREYVFVAQAWRAGVETAVRLATASGEAHLEYPVPSDPPNPALLGFDHRPSVRVTLGLATVTVSLWPMPVPISDPLGSTRRPLLRAGGTARASYWPGRS